MLLQSAGHLCVLLGVRVVARTEAKARLRAVIPQRECDVFILESHTRTSSGRILSWVDDHEFTVDGSMYDVVRRHDSANVMVIVAVRDGADSWWHAAMNTEQDQQSRQRSKSAPIQDLLTKIASVKAISTAAPSLNPPPAALLRYAPHTAEPECAGYTPPVDRPPLMS
ncbi:MAG: hypothetical protein FGM32_09870 [Candidatus Kapabacteria bacterium]|nr:hypothetical protein [Candidatus Kapabacteria bacterium]